MVSTKRPGWGFVYSIDVFEGRLHRQREVFFVEINFGFYPRVLDKACGLHCAHPHNLNIKVHPCTIPYFTIGSSTSHAFFGLLHFFDRWESNSWHLVQRRNFKLFPIYRCTLFWDILS